MSSEAGSCVSVQNTKASCAHRETNLVTGSTQRI